MNTVYGVKKIIKYLPGMALGLFLSLVSCGENQSANEENEVSESEAMVLPENARTLFENEHLKVVSVKLQSGESLPTMGNNDDFLVYEPRTIEQMYAGDTLAVTDSTGKQVKDYTAPSYEAEVLEDTTETMNWVAGKMYNPGQFRGNDSGVEADYLLIWRLNGGAGASMEASGDMTEEDDMDSTSHAKKGHHKKLYEVLGSANGLTLEEVFIPEGDTLEREETLPRALFFLTSHTYHYYSPDQSRRNVSNERGQMQWHETARGYLVNSGPTPVRMLVIKTSK